MSTQISGGPLPRRQAWLALGALSLGFFMSLLDQSVIAVATPDIAAHFDADLNQVVWVSSIYLLAVVVPLLVTGRMGDRFGHRRMFQVGISVFTLAAGLGALAPTIEALIAARALQGFGASLLMPQTMAVINQIFPREHRGRALGVWGVVGSLAGLVGPVLGGFVVGQFGWQGVFFMHVPVGLLALILSGLWVPRLPVASTSIDLISVAVSLVALGGVVFVIQQGPEMGWPWWLWLIAAIGVGAGVWFLKLQRTAGKRGSDALVPLQLFRDRNYTVGTISVAAMGFIAAAMMLPVMLWLQSVRGLDADTAGVVVAPMALVALVVGPVAGNLADRRHPRALSHFGFAFMIAAFLGMWATMRFEGPLWLIVLSLTGLGIGQSFVWATTAATALRDIAPENMGAASGVYNTTRQLGSVLGVAATSTVMQVSVSGSGADAGLADALWLFIAAAVVGLVAATYFRFTVEPARIQK